MNVLRKVKAAAEHWVETVFRTEDMAGPIFGGRITYTGKPVTERSALRTTAVFRCVQLISEAGASLPVDVFRVLPDGRREPLPKHQVEYLLDSTPNPDMSSMDFRVAMWACLKLWGNAYALKVTEGNRIIALWPLQPDYVTVKYTQAGELVYVVRVPGKEVIIYKADQIFHVRGFSLDGIHGLSPIECAKEGIAMNQAMQEYGARFFQNGAAPRLALEYGEALDDKTIAKIRESFEAQYAGVENAHKIAILHRGATLKTLTIPPKDSEYLAIKNASDEEVAMLYGVPPHMIGIVGKSTSWGTGIGEQKQGFLDFTLGPSCVYWEKAAERCLLSESERDISIKHNTSAFLRMDPKARMESHAIAVEKGIYSRNEVRALEDKNPYEGGDTYTVQAQLIPINMLEEFHRGQKAKTGGGVE